MGEDNLLLSALLDTDSYKFSHWVQYPPNTTAMSSYFESRGGDGDKTVFFGLQYLLKKYLSKPITVENVKEAEFFASKHGVPFNHEGWMYIATELEGKLPIAIYAVPEGSVIPKHNVLMRVDSTDPKCFWVVSWVETLLVRLWYSITVATTSYETKQIIMDNLKMTSDDPEGEIAFKLHDFGSRGASTQESAMVGGASHLISFMGSDTVAGIWMANKYYDADMAGFSISASEHSTITMWGKDREVDAYRNMIKQYGNSGIFACVSDSYDIYNAAEKIWGEVLKQEVLDCNATIVIRPDSGDPVAVIQKLLKILDDKFGSTINSKGYRVLNKVRLIQGDGIDKSDINRILTMMYYDGYSGTNIAFGMGGGLLQRDINRDTHKFAFKCCYALVDGKVVQVSKAPATDTGKKSKAGLLDLVVDEGNNVTTVNQLCNLDELGNITESRSSLLQRVFKNGEIKGFITFEAVRNNSKITYY